MLRGRGNGDVELPGLGAGDGGVGGWNWGTLRRKSLESGSISLEEKKCPHAHDGGGTD